MLLVDEDMALTDLVGVETRMSGYEIHFTYKYCMNWVAYNVTFDSSFVSSQWQLIFIGGCRWRTCILASQGIQNSSQD